MKKIGLFLVVSLFSVFCLTSCLESSNIVEGESVGVMTYGKGYSAILKSPGYWFGGPSIDALYAKADMEIGKCYAFYYRHDGDLPENAPNVVEANGYNTVSILGYVEIDKYYMNSYLTDTSTVLYGEEPVINGCERIIAYVENNLFLTHIINQAADLQLEWDMSYDTNTMVPTEEGSQRFYDIYIRAIKRNSSDKSKTDVAVLNAYNIGSYLENAASNEKSFLGSSFSESSSVLTLRFNYVSEIDEDNKITWKSKTERLGIAAILASN